VTTHRCPWPCTSSGRRVPAGCTVRVDGHLDDHWSDWFTGFTLTHEGDGTTRLSSPGCDQAQLHGVLARIRDLSVTLLSVAVIDPPDGADPD